MNTSPAQYRVRTRALVRRLTACLFGGFVAALMVGPQEGSQTDFGLSFHEATRPIRLLVFLSIGLVVFGLVTAWPQLKSQLDKPGSAAIGAGLVLIVTGMGLLRWYDPVGKLGAVDSAVSSTSGAPPLVAAFFSPAAWALAGVGAVVGLAAVARRSRVLGYVQCALSVTSAVIAFVAHEQLVHFAGGIDHSLGVYATAAGYLVLAFAGVVAAHATAAHRSTSAGIEQWLTWRPGLVPALAGLALGLVAFAQAAWFAPLQADTTFAGTGDLFSGAGLPGVASAYLRWLGPVLFGIAGVAAVAGSLFRLRVVSWCALAGAAFGLVLTFVTLYHIAETGAEVGPQYGRRWANLGAGGWVACIAFFLLGVAGLFAGHRPGSHDGESDAAPSGIAVRSSDEVRERPATRGTLIGLAAALVLFYPPTLPSNWQNVIVTQIAAYLLLAVGLNVVVGWAGLLDLGYIAFYGIGSYTTAYLTGALPLKPPGWLHFSPLVAIPFAIAACLVAGVLLGAPTLRLRGDYLAIVTLGFGEIIQLVAINNPHDLTGGPIGPTVPHPVIHAGPVHVTFGLDNLPYWYLLLALLVIVIVLFARLEGSRIGRAWAAIREDEVAAQASGVRTTRLKLLAFAIGASTSGVAGVFFATQVGYFDPSQFTLQNSILILAYVVFGGMGSLVGTLVGAAVLTWLPYFLQSQVPLQDTQMWIGALVLAMMIFRPEGLIPARRRKAELSGLEAAADREVGAVPAREGI
ncbi:branched-chain amino acid ABC transporter permease [Catenulispora rubra]|uniref:branched-chain amino acid ABC transporter permease n=1 Tax=Catenulispora rubra TaxID=280293 RepID=UPI001E319FDC|nr:branched-chain amino acid ABC transporter permease [Catenulispora rubra]